jgi:hypothetical protein
MRESLAEFYQRMQMLSSLEARLPEDVGDGRISRICTPQGVSLSTWVMRYHRDTPVEGMVGDELRLLFCLGEGVEWQNEAGKTLCVRPSRACLCMGDGSVERMCYGSGYGYAFHQISIARGHAAYLVKSYLPEMDIDWLVQTINARDFSITRDMHRLMDGIDALGRTGSLGLLRLECCAHELLALCMGRQTPPGPCVATSISEGGCWKVLKHGFSGALPERAVSSRLTEGVIIPLPDLHQTGCQ